jgi:ComEC/Rec2-related protein
MTAWPRQPFVGLAVASVLGIALADLAPRPAAGFAGVLFFPLLALFRKSSLATYPVVVCSFFLLHSLRQTASPGLRLARVLGEEPQAITARGFVASEPNISARETATFLLRLSSIEHRGVTRTSDATLFARWRGDVHFGDELLLFGVAEPIAPPRNPGEFDLRAYLARRDVRHALVVRYPENGRILSRSGGNPILRAAQISRHWMQAALSRGLESSPDLSSLISGMVLGAGDETPDEIEEHFQQTGTLHLFAVSGLNVAIVAYLLWTLARALRLPRRWAIGLIIPSLFFYAAVTGLNPSSVRAALMAALLLGGFFADRRVLPGNSLAAAAVLTLCFDTNQLFSIGFQLSFVVVIALIWLANPLFNLFMRWGQADPFLPRSLFSPLRHLLQQSWRAVARGASVSLAAWLGSLPLILPYFHLITPVSLFANLVVVPIAFFVLAIGLMSLLVTPVAVWLAIVFNNANWSLAWLILKTVELFAQAPAGHFYLEPPRWPDGARMQLTALDLGAGAAVHVRTRKSDWLFDPGGERDFKPIVRGYLRSRGINRLDGMLVSHGDSAHIGAASAVLRAFRPREIVDTAVKDRSTAHRAFVAELAGRGIAPKLCAAGDELRLSRDVTARILFPPRYFHEGRADDEALVVQLIVAGMRVLLMSDSGKKTEQALLRTPDLRSDIIIKGQHYSGESGSPEFLDVVNPVAIIATSRDFSENQRIKDEWEADLASRGIKLFRQDRTGAVTLRFFRDRWEATPYLTSETFRSQSR